MRLTPYRRILALPGVSRLVVVAILARVPQTASGVVLTLHVVQTLRLGYAAAGVVATVTTVGLAVGSPWRGRAIDRVGLRRALVPSVLVGAAVWSVSPFVGFVALLPLSFVGGVLGLPVFTVARQSLSVLVPQEQRRTALALDSIGVEISFMMGPALGVLVATAVSTRAAMLAVGASTVVAGLMLIALDPPTHAADVPSVEKSAVPVPAPQEPPRRAGWFSVELAAILAAALASTVVLAGTDVSLIAHLRSHGAVAFTGVAFAAWGFGSILGGLVYGALRRPPSAQVLLLALGVLTIPVGLAGSPWLLTLTILPAAAACAPVITATADAVARIVPGHVLGEAMGWHGSALMVGVALGAPLAGTVIDASRPWAGFASVGVLGAALAVLALLLPAGGRRRRGHPLTAGTHGAQRVSRAVSVGDRPGRLSD